jgi:hypothetical protein
MDGKGMLSIHLPDIPLPNIHLSFKSLRAQQDSTGSHFGIDRFCYAIMSNHFQLILRSRPNVMPA